MEPQNRKCNTEILNTIFVQNFNVTSILNHEQRNHLGQFSFKKNYKINRGMRGTYEENEDENKGYIRFRKWMKVKVPLNSK